MRSNNNNKTRILVKTIELCEYHFYLDGDIQEPEDYREEFDTLISADPNDVINIHINSPGGYLSTALQFINLIEVCPAHIRGFIHMECASAASLIALACEELEVFPFGTMMIHTASHGTWGKDSDVIRQSQFAHKHVKAVIEASYAGFLSKEEIQQVLDGKEFWFDKPEIEKRLQLRANPEPEEIKPKRPSRKKT